MSRLRRHPWSWLPVSVFGALVFVILLGDRSGRGQAANPDGSQPERKARKADAFPDPSTSCVDCHNQDRNKSVHPKSNARR